MAITEQQNMENAWGGVSNFKDPSSIDDLMESEDNLSELANDDGTMSDSQAIAALAELEARRAELMRQYDNNPENADLSATIAQLDDNIGTLEESFMEKGTSPLNAMNAAAATADNGKIIGASYTESEEVDERKKKEIMNKQAYYAAFVAVAHSATLPLPHSFLSDQQAFDYSYANLFEGPNSLENISLQAAENVANNPENAEMMDTLSAHDEAFHAIAGPETVVQATLADLDAAIEEAKAAGDTETVAQLTEIRDDFADNADMKLQAMKVDDPTTDAGQQALDTTLTTLQQENPELVAAAGGAEEVRTYLVDILGNRDDASLALNEDEVAKLENELATTNDPIRIAEITKEIAQNDIMIAHMDTMSDVKLDQALQLGAETAQMV